MDQKEKRVYQATYCGRCSVIQIALNTKNTSLCFDVPYSHQSLCRSDIINR